MTGHCLTLCGYQDSHKHNRNDKNECRQKRRKHKNQDNLPPPRSEQYGRHGASKQECRNYHTPDEHRLKRSWFGAFGAAKEGAVTEEIVQQIPIPERKNNSPELYPDANAN